MERQRCPQAREIEGRLAALRRLADDLPEAYDALRTALGELSADWDAQADRAPCPLAAPGVLQAMVDHSHAQMAFLDPQFNFVAVNAAYAAGSGYASDQLIGRNHFALFPNAENEAVFAQARDSGEPVTFAAKPFVFANRPDWGITYWDWTLAPIQDAAGATSGLVLSLSDVTARELSRQALAESEGRYRLLVDTMAEGLASLDTEGCISFVNDEFCRMLGYTREELLGLHHLGVVPEGHHQRHRDEFAKRTGGEAASFETLLRRRDGSALPVLQAGRPLRDGQGRIHGTLAAFTDISALRTAEAALGAERDFVATVLDTADALVIVLDTQGRIARFNRACERLTGYTFDEVQGIPFWDLFLLPEEADGVRATFGDLITAYLPNHHENYWVARDGTRRFISWANTAILADDGAVQYIVGTGIDVTEVRRAEAEMRDLARFPSENPNPVMRIARDGRILSANQASARLLGMWATQQGAPVPANWCGLVADALAAHEIRVVVLPCGDTVYTVGLVPIVEAGYVNLYASDTTAQARAQEALQLARDELEWRVQERTRDLEAANQALEALSASERRQRLAAEGLLQATMALNSSLLLDEVLDRILEQTRLAVICPAVAIVPASEETAHTARQRGLAELVQGGGSLSALLPLSQLYGLDGDQAAPTSRLAAYRRTDGQGQGLSALAWVRSWVATPLLVDGQLIGSLCAFSDRAYAFGPETLHLMEGFAAHAATAIHNAALYEAALRAQRLAENLTAASVALTPTLDLETVTHTLLDYLQLLVAYDGATLALSRDRGRLVVRAARGVARSAGHEVIVDVESSSPLRTVIDTQHSVVLGGSLWQRAGGCLDGPISANSWLGVPLVVGGQVIGVCELSRSAGEPFSAEQVRVAEALVGQAATAIQNAWLFGQVRSGQQRLQALSHRLVEAQEAERRHIARELHDDTAQVLISLKVGLSLLDRQAAQSVPVGATLDDLRSALDGVLLNLSRLTTRLRPATLDHLGLDSALRQYLEGIGHQHGLGVAYEAVGLDERLEPDTETALYRIVQEAVSNVVRHAHATRVDVLLERRADKVILLVEDNATGFDVSAVEAQHSLGLAGMRERAEILGGRLVVESMPGAGATLLVEVPYGD